MADTASDTANPHYDESYFAFQRAIGNFGKRANLIKFRDFIRPTDTVIDFGAGGGFLLSQIDCGEKIGVEVNPNGRANGNGLGICMVERFAELSDEIADVVISNHALEHTDHPLSHLREAYTKLKPGGLAVFVVPCEQVGYRWRPNDINFHIHSLGPMSFGNLFTRAGFEVLESRPFFHKWPPHYLTIQKLFGWSAFHMIARLYSHLARHYIQVRCVARKPA